MGGRVAELLGQHRYQLDAKGRIALPARFREALADGAYLTLGQDRCLWVFPAGEWQRRKEEFLSRPLTDAGGRAAARLFFSNAESVEPDRQGRLVVPHRLRSQVGLEREAVVIGVYDRLEVWAAGEWDRYEAAHIGSYSEGILQP
jgi:MraZ protein